MENKVIIVGPKADGGISKVINNLYDGGINDDHNVFFYASSFEPPASFGFLWLLNHTIVLFRIIGFLFTIVKLNPTIVHIHTSSKGSFYRKSVYALISKALNKKLIIHIHPTHFMDFLNKSAPLLRKYIITILNLSNLLIVLTDKVKNEIKQICDENTKVLVLKNPITLDKYIFTKKVKRSSNTLLYLGWIIKNKGVYDLLNVAPIIKKKIKDFKLIYCGNKEVAKLRKMVGEKGLGSYVDVKGWIDGNEKEVLLLESTALILPTYSEGLPNVILEAMAASLPILTTPVGGIPTILTKNENCLYFEPGNITEMSEKIIELFLDTDKQQRIARNNSQLVKMYDSKIIAGQLKTIYQQI